MKKKSLEHISDDVRDFFTDEVKKKNFHTNLKFEFINNPNQKMLVKISKLSDTMSFILGKDLLVVFNEDMYDNFDDISKEILVCQELDKIEVNNNTGEIKLKRLNFTTSVGVISKYNVEDVVKANQVTELYVQQTKDKEKDAVAA